jgi:ABC-type glycerol-3-phosphate transport system substrate-binding protein
MYAAGPFMGAVTESNKATYANIATSPMPFGNGAPITVTNFLAVPKGAKQKDLAIKLILTILQDHYQQRAVELIKAIPARRNMIPPNFLAENPWFKTFSDVAATAVSYAPEGAEQYGSDIIKIVGNDIEAMLFRGVSAQQTADTMQADLVRFMADKK